MFSNAAKRADVRRSIGFLLPLALCQCLDGSTQGTTRPLDPRRFAITSTPVALDATSAGRLGVGRLRYMGGWQLTSDMRGFGGLSGLDVRQGAVTAVSDVGAIIRFNIGRFGNVGTARIDPIPPGCGTGRSKYDSDAESLTRDRDGRRWWVGFEWANALCRTDDMLARGEAVARPAAMRRWHRRRGAETLVHLADGRVIVIEEGGMAAGSAHAALVFDRDPTDPAVRMTAFEFVPPAGYAPVDAAQLPDGRMLVLTRRFALTSLFTAKLVLVERLPTRAGARFAGRTIATFAPPVIAENFEGVATSREAGQTIVWLVSDDNYQRWQRTLLLKFALD